MAVGEQRGDRAPTRRYEPMLPLSKGGMGTVELALRSGEGFERVYAVKRIRAEFRTNSTMRQMFLEEARLAGLIRHANVVSVLDLGEDEQGPYLVMDYIEGLCTRSRVGARVIL